jgi:hypothetical protein
MALVAPVVRTTLPSASSRTEQEVPPMTGGSNTLISGPNRLTNQPLSGMTVGDVRDRFSEALNIPDGAVATINDISVEDEQTLVNGETLIFSKPLGSKGV